MSDILKENLDDIPKCFRQYPNQTSDKTMKANSNFDELLLIVILFLLCSK